MTLDHETFSWLLLRRLPGLTPALLRRLAGADPHGAASGWLGWHPDKWAALGAGASARDALAEWRRRGLATEAAQAARRDGEWLAATGAHLIHLLHPAYPPLLLEIADPPPCLYIRGDVECLSAPQLAVVGSRQPTRQGLADAEALAGALAAAGFVITSGLAYGIDAAAHRATLAGGGRTVAVLGSGLDVIYPARHRELAAAIAAGGAVITELPPGTPPKAGHFPRRNRIISGLSLGVLVVEAALQSGSLVTARLALEQNREVFALPGSIHNPSSRGCNLLIRQGAKLVVEAQDVLDELRGWSRPRADGSAIRPPAPPDLPDVESAVLAAIGYQPTPLDVVLERVSCSLSELLAALSELELKGLAENRAGSWLRCDG